jgi:hypothetical protein
MSTLPPLPPPLPDHELGSKEAKVVELAQNARSPYETDDDSIDLKKEIYDTSAIDPILAKKMALTNTAIDEIGMTPWQWKLFCLNGFGYAVDSVCISSSVFSVFDVADPYSS